MDQFSSEFAITRESTSTALGPVYALEPLIGASGLASRSLITDGASRPPTLAGCFSFVTSHPDVPEGFRSALSGVLGHIVQSTGRDASDLPADPVALRPVIADVELHTLLAGHKRWTRHGLLQSTLIFTGWLDPDARKRDKLPEPWEVLLIEAGCHGRRRALAAFFRWCYRRDLSLASIEDETLVDYAEWLAQWTLDPGPWKTARAVRQAWADMQSRCATWPGGNVRLPPRRKSRLATRTDLSREELVSASGRATRALITEDAARPSSLGACFDFASSRLELSLTFRRDVIRAKRTVGRVTGRDPSDLPTDLAELRTILRAIQPIHSGLSSKSWQNVLSLTRSVLILCGWLSSDSRKRQVLPQPWAGLLSAAEVHQKHRALPPFFRFCVRCRLTPESVTSETLQDYVDWLTGETLNPDPWQTGLWVKQAWMHMQRLDPTWPATDIGLPTRRIYKRRTDFPASFHADLEAYLHSLTKRHLRDSTYRDDPLSSATINLIRYTIIRAATFLANADTPVEEIAGIASLVKPEACEAILLAAINETGDRWNTLALHIATHLLDAAKRWIKPSAEVLEDLEEQCRYREVQRSSRKRRDLVAQFATPEERGELRDLPLRAFEQADLMLTQDTRGRKKMRAAPERAARLHETGLALALLFTQPIRIGNLVALDLKKHFVRDRRGKLSRIFIDAHEVKNATDIEIFLPEPLIERIERHLTVFRPILLRGASSSVLFPGRGGRAQQTQTLGKRLRRIVEQQLGARFTPHLARHLAAEFLLEKDVNNLPVAQRLLGHARPETTALIYGLVRTSTAQRVYARLVEEDRVAVKVQENRKIRRKAR
jgi:integrase